MKILWAPFVCQHFNENQYHQYLYVLYRRTQLTAFNKVDNCQLFNTQSLLWGHTLIADWQALMSIKLWLFFIISITITFHKWLMVQILFDFNDILSISQMGLCLCVWFAIFSFIPHCYSNFTFLVFNNQMKHRHNFSNSLNN